MTRLLRRTRVTASTVQALAEAVSSDGDAHLLTPDNVYNGTVDLPTAVGSGSAFYVRVDRVILALDMDDPTARDALEEIATRLHIYGITPVVLSSGGRGRRHLFARVTDPVLRTRFERQARDARIDVRRDIRPPLSPHRLGHDPVLLSPDTPQDALTALQATPPTRPPLSEPMETLYARGNDAGRYDSWSEALAACATAAINAGWTEEDYTEVVCDPATGIGAEFADRCRTRGEADSLRRVHQAWDNQTAWVDEHPARGQADLPILAALRAAIDTHPFPARTAPTDKVVYEALIRRAEVPGLLRFTCSQREICQLAAIGSRNTVKSSLARLEQMGLVKRSLHRGDGQATTWTLLTHGLDTSDPSFSHPRYEVSGSHSDLGHDLWRYGKGLGKTRMRTYHALLNGPRTAQQVAEQTRRRVPTIRKHFQILEDYRLIEKVDDTHWAASPHADLDAEAEAIGIAGRGEQQAQAFQRERDAYTAHRKKKAQEDKELLDFWRSRQKQTA